MIGFGRGQYMNPLTLWFSCKIILDKHLSTVQICFKVRTPFLPGDYIPISFFDFCYYSYYYNFYYLFKYGILCPKWWHTCIFISFKVLI